MFWHDVGQVLYWYGVVLVATAAAGVAGLGVAMLALIIRDEAGL